MPPKTPAPAPAPDDPRVYHEIFRNSSIGTTFADTLDERVKDGRLTGEQANTLMLRFDKAIADSLSKVRAHFKFKGKCTTYRHCDDIWIFDLVDITFTFKAENEVVHAEKVKIVANEYEVPKEKVVRKRRKRNEG